MSSGWRWTWRKVRKSVWQRCWGCSNYRLSGPALPETVPVGVKASAPAALIIMTDGWLARQRGEDWGHPPAGRTAERVVWHEIKGAVIYRLEPGGQTTGGRGLIAQKYVVAWQGEPLEFGRRVQAEARRRGLAEAKEVFVVADGSMWVWNVQQDRYLIGTNFGQKIRCGVTWHPNET